MEVVAANDLRSRLLSLEGYIAAAFGVVERLLRYGGNARCCGRDHSYELAVQSARKLWWTIVGVGWGEKGQFLHPAGISDAFQIMTGDVLYGAFDRHEGELGGVGSMNYKTEDGQVFPLHKVSPMESPEYMGGILCS